jgi:hypothetical protein
MAVQVLKYVELFRMTLNELDGLGAACMAACNRHALAHSVA